MRSVLLFLFLLLCSNVIHAQQMPVVTAKDLNKKPVTWPRDLTTEQTVLIIAFERNQQPMVDSWIKGLGLKDNKMISWYEVPVINNPGKFVRGFIDNGMRKGIPTTEARRHVVTLYVKKKEFMKAMQLDDEDVHVLIVDRSGKVVTRSKGIYTMASAAPIQRFLQK
jgi:hypothetical protein